MIEIGDYFSVPTFVKLCEYHLFTKIKTDTIEYLSKKSHDLGLNELHHACNMQHLHELMTSKEIQVD